MNFKQKTPRDKKYLAWIKTLPCQVCRTPGATEPHHTETGGIGIKGSDYSCVPLCHVCHQKLHMKQSKSGMWSKEQLMEITGRLQSKFNNI